ncbi:MAG: UvrD-helicase domain-containing protein [Lachnospiraceae bacterium]|nr:UvrD-helicase domain-containing protein [Lachnospiraceae bacterium]
MTEQEKRNSIINDLDKNMFIEAGAGAGKTDLIVSRITNQLKKGILPEEIVAITFTNAATHELKDRILRRVRKVLSDKALTDEEEKNLKSAAYNIDRMQISTIHSFCLRLLKERMFEAKMPVDVKIIEDAELVDLEERHFDRCIEGLGRKDYLCLSENDTPKWKSVSMLKSLSKQLMSIPGDMEVKIAAEGAEAGELEQWMEPILRGICDDAAIAYGGQYASIADIPDGELTAYAKKIKEAAKRGAVLDTAKSIISLPGTQSFAIKPPAAGKTKADRDNNKAIKEKLTEAEEKLKAKIDIKVAEAVITRYESHLYDPYVGIARRVRETFYDDLPARFLTNDLIIEKTRKLIFDHMEARKYFADKFRCIYVDEFQDTDHVQESFIWRIASDPDDPEKLRDGALFVVGDPKQSIYRFRGAEPEVYFEVRDRFKKLDNSCVYELSENFRSNERLIEWINDEFALRDITPGSPYVPMQAVNVLPDTVPDDVISGFYRYKSPEQAKPKTEIGEDVSAVTNLILNLKNGNHRIADRDISGEVFFRKTEFSDFLVLCMNMAGMDRYAEFMRSHGIPVVMDSRTDLSGDSAVNIFIRIYAFLAYPFDRASVVGAKEALYASGIPEEDTDDMLRLIKTETDDLSAYGCIGYLQDHMELILPKDEDIAGYEANRAKTRIVQMCENVLAKAAGNRPALLAAMKDHISVAEEHELDLTYGKNSVRFMNLHKAKGLEGNIVIWTNRTENKEHTPGAFRNGMDFYPSISYGEKSFGSVWQGNKGNEELVERAKRDDTAEKIRLEYVAATRAKQAFIFMDRYNKSDGNLFCPDFGLEKLTTIEGIVAEKDNKYTEPSGDPWIFAAAPPFDKNASEAAFEDITPSGLEEESAGKEGKVDPEEKPGTKSARPIGNIIGNVLHRAMELLINRWDLSDEKSFVSKTDVVELCIQQAVNENHEDIPEGEESRYHDFVKDAVWAFGKWYSKSDIRTQKKAVYTELPFSYCDRKDDRTRWVHGSADLVFVLDGGICHVFDYKSDSDRSYKSEEAFEERLRGKYSGQISAYREAIARLFGTEPGRVKATLVSFPEKFGAKDGLTVRLTEL